MRRLVGHGLEIALPRGWEGGIEVARPLDAEAVVQRRAATGTAPAMTPVAHVANVPLPPDRGDFGSGAVETLPRHGAFVALVEFGPAEVGTALFAAPLPHRIAARDLHPRALQRTIRGQCGMQAFGHRGGRPFSLYVVLGRDRDLAPLVDEVNDVLGGVSVAAR